MKTSLATPIKRDLSISEFEVFSVTDNPPAKTITAEVSVANVGMVTLSLWTDDDYDSIGQWTDDDATARVKELLVARYTPSK